MYQKIIKHLGALSSIDIVQPIGAADTAKRGGAGVALVLRVVLRAPLPGGEAGVG